MQIKCCLYLKSFLWGETDFYFQIFNLSQFLLQLSHFPHLKLYCYLERCRRTSLLNQSSTLRDPSHSLHHLHRIERPARIKLGEDASPDKGCAAKTCRRMLTARRKLHTCSYSDPVWLLWV